jgi:magnesium and cobalt transporter
LLKAARFDQLLVGDVMKPRAHIVAVEASATLAEVAMLFAESQHSRLPIYRDTLDDPLGFVHVKEVLALLAPTAQGAATAKPTDRVLMRIKRDVIYVPASMRLPNLLLKMRTSRSHLALVVDEYGGTDGLVSIEDLVEIVVGDIEDEFDSQEDVGDIFALADQTYRVSGDASLERVGEAFGTHLEVTAAEASDDTNFDTIGGFIAHAMGHVPRRGEHFEINKLRFEVLHTRGGAVKWFKVYPAPVEKAQP